MTLKPGGGGVHTFNPITKAAGGRGWWISEFNDSLILERIPGSGYIDNSVWRWGW